MTAAAYLLKRDFGPSNGLDRRYCTEMYHVVNISAAWKRSTTNQEVFSVCPQKGDAHSDPALAGAICTMVRLISGPWFQSDGTSEAIVSCTFDSDRRWGAAFNFSASEEDDNNDQLVPNWRRENLASGVVNWVWNPAPFKRPGIIRIEPRDATGITGTQRAAIYELVGTVFMIDHIPYLMRTPSITVMRTNQTIIRFRFWTAPPRPPLAASLFAGMDVAVPALTWLDMYLPIPDQIQPSVGKISGSSYGHPENPSTTLPFWDGSLIP